MPSVAATVHIVDDDPHICESLSLMVRDTGLAVRTYPSAEAFLTSCPEFSHEPQCLVLDVRMPGLDGLSLQQILHARGKHIPTVMISGSADVRMAVQAMIAGAVVFLEKPFGQDALLSHIREALERDTRGSKRRPSRPKWRAAWKRSPSASARFSSAGRRQARQTDCQRVGHRREDGRQASRHGDGENAGGQRGRPRPLDGRRKSRVQWNVVARGSDKQCGRKPSALTARGIWVECRLLVASR